MARVSAGRAFLVTSALLLAPFHFAAAKGQATSTPPPPADQKSAQSAPAQSHDDISPDDLPEEDESLKPKIYPLDPLEAQRNIKIGNFYMRQGGTRGFRAAAGRFQDATKYDPGSAEAFYRLGEAEEKLKHDDKAKAAFERVLRIAPDSKLAKDAKKKLGSRG